MTRVVVIEDVGDHPVRVTQTFRAVVGGSTFEQEIVVPAGQSARFPIYPGVESITIRTVEPDGTPQGTRRSA